MSATSIAGRCNNRVIGAERKEVQRLSDYIRRKRLFLVSAAGVLGIMLFVGACSKDDQTLENTASNGGNAASAASENGGSSGSTGATGSGAATGTSGNAGASAGMGGTTGGVGGNTAGAGGNTGGTAGTTGGTGGSSGGAAGTAGSAGGTAGSAGAVSCGEPTGAPSCDACIAEICCAAGAACDVGSPCDTLYHCLDGCVASDQACQDAYVNDNPDSVQAFIDFYQNCKFGSCNTDCGGAVCDSGIVFSDPELGSCVGAVCCQEFKACTMNNTNVQACLDCLNGAASADPTLCQQAADCIGPNGAGADCFPNVCDPGIAFNDPALSECVLGNCYAEFGACAQCGADVQGCIDCLNNVPGSDPSVCLAAQNCMGPGGFAYHCFPAVCDSGFTLHDAALSECLSNACCAEYEACTNNGSDIPSCVDCLNAGGTDALCSAAATCSQNAACEPSGICDSGLTTGNTATDNCLEAACCVEFDECTNSGADPQPCIDCFNQAAGADPNLCANAIACKAANCP